MLVVIKLLKKEFKFELKYLIFLVVILFGAAFSRNFSERIPFKSGGDYKMDESITARIEAYKIGYKLWKESPILGKGFGSFFTNKESDGWRFILKYPHNIFIEALSELGLIGFIFVLFLIIKSFVFTFNNFNYLIPLLSYFFISSLTSKDITINFIVLIFYEFISSTSGILKNNINKSL